MPKVTEGAAKLEQAPRAGLCFTQGTPAACAKQEDVPNALELYAQYRTAPDTPSCLLGPAPSRRPDPALPSPSCSVGPGLCSSGLRTPWGWEWGTGGGDWDENHNRIKNSRGWADGLGGTTKNGTAYTQGIFLHTLVHTPRYSTCKNICYSHTRLLQGPREPVAAALVGFG